MQKRGLALVVALTAPPSLAWEWPRSTPDAEGLDGRPLEAFDAELSRGDHGYVDSMLVIRHGRIVLERSYHHDYARLFDEKRHGPRGIYNYYDDAWHPYYRRTRLHTMQSVSKSVPSRHGGRALPRAPRSREARHAALEGWPVGGTACGPGRLGQGIREVACRRLL